MNEKLLNILECIVAALSDTADPRCYADTADPRCYADLERALASILCAAAHLCIDADTVREAVSDEAVMQVCGCTYTDICEQSLEKPAPPVYVDDEEHDPGDITSDDYELPD